MRDSSIFNRAQVVLTLFGSFMLLMTAVSTIETNEIPSSPSSSDGTGLQVRPAQGSPGTTINQLQGAGGLQGQKNQALQRPVGEQLQPNAKTKNLNGTQQVQ